MNKLFSNSVSSIGYNHIKANTICEDASDFYSDEAMHICVVADGHGSADYPRTDRGSQYAVNAAIQCIVEFINNALADDVLVDEARNYSMLRQLSKSILNIWHQSIYNDYLLHPFTEKELGKVNNKYRERYTSLDESQRRIEKAYGTTLIVFAVTKEFSFGLQIGDGKCVIVDQNGDFIEPIPWDENCQLNVTTSLCDYNAIDEFRYFITNARITAVFCGTDGIEDSYASTEELYALYRSILNIYIEHGIEVGNSEIKEYLPILSKQGSGDDVSIASIIDFEALKSIRKILSIEDEIFDLQRQLFETKEKLFSCESRFSTIQKNVEKAVKNSCMLSKQAEEYDAILKDIHAFRENINNIEAKIKEKIMYKQDVVYEKDKASFGNLELVDEYHLDKVVSESIGNQTIASNDGAKEPVKKSL